MLGKTEHCMALKVCGSKVYTHSPFLGNNNIFATYLYMCTCVHVHVQCMCICMYPMHACVIFLYVHVHVDIVSQMVKNLRNSWRKKTHEN